ncbi:MAG: aspartate aminotransferase family protein [Chloroflexi bacterium]|nr:aspartate aminotransferase family protein [Chloroflexota bacterium]
MIRHRSHEEATLIERAQRVLPGGSLGNVYYPGDQAMIIQRGQGAHVWDVSGNRYVDYLLGSGPMVLGHAHPAVLKAVSSYLERGSTYFSTNEPVIYLAEEIVRAVPCAEKVRFMSSGSEATFFAMRLARAHRRRPRILKFEGGYHGSSDYAVMSVTPKDLSPFPQAAPNSAGVPAALADTMLIAPFNDLSTAANIIEKHQDELAGVIVEPFQRLIPPAPGFLQGLRQVTQAHGIPLIFDEVVTGFRFAYGGAQQYYGVVPDLAALGKIVGGGYPLSAVAGREEIMRHFDPVMEASNDFVPLVGTLSGNPVAAVAGLATLEQLRKPGTYQRLFATGNKLRTGLAKVLHEAELPAQVVGEDPLFDVYFTDQPVVDYRSTLRANSQMMKRFNNLLLERGILKGASKFYVSLAHSDDDVDFTLRAFREAAEALRGAG